MKKVIYCLTMLLMMPVMLLFSGCGKITYKIDDSNFDNIVAYNSEISFDGLNIIVQDGDKNTPVAVAPDMIVSCDDTTTVGDKKLIIKYSEETLTVNFVVKYKVDFVVDSQVYETKYVLTKDELTAPAKNPTLAEYDFVGWDYDFDSQINDNITINAQLTVAGSGVPKLATYYSATYGDTLENITLPSNAKGKWQFVDPKATSVGDAGENIFKARFIPQDQNLVPGFEQDVTIKVAKKQLEFTSIVDQFSYDGTEKTPTYSLPVEGLETEYIKYYSDGAIDAGEYEYEIDIVDKNYKGSYFGVLKIKAVTATITIDSITIKFTDECPEEFDYAVYDKDSNPLSKNLQDLMGITINKPEYQHAGSYEIGAEIANKNFNVTIVKGILNVQKVEHDLDEFMPTFVGGQCITYGDNLSDVVFENTDVRGTWSWKTDTQVLDTVSYTATAVFTPKEDKDYLVSEREITLDVLKKVLKVDVTSNEYTYDTQNHTVEYSITGLINEDTVDVLGNISKVNAGEYPVILTLADAELRYYINVETSLIINKASIADFTTVYDKPWSSSLLLQDIILNAGYTWNIPLTHITEIGTQEYMATFTPEDIDNYKTEQNLITVDIVRAEATITKPTTTIFTYNKQGYTLNGISPSHSESSLSYVYTYNGSVVEKLDNAGTYELTVTLPQSAHHNAAYMTTRIVINKVENNDILKNNILAIYGDYLSNDLLPTSDFGTWTWQEGTTTTVGNVGNQKHIAVFTPNDTINYESRKAEITFVVDKQVVQLPIIEAKTFDNSLLTADIESNAIYTVIENNGGIQLGDYGVKLRLIDTSNYRWAGDVDSSEIVVTFSIQKNVNNKWTTKPYIESFEYGAGTPRYLAEAQFGEVFVTFIEKESGIVLARPTNVGDYLVKFTIPEDESYNGLEATLEFSITHILVKVPTIKNVTYTGSAIDISLEENGFTIDENISYTNVGDYGVKVSLIDNNYRWKDGYASAQRIIPYSIEKNNSNDWTTQPTFSGWTYNPNGGTPATATAQFGSASITYKERDAADSTYSAALPINAGAYIVRYIVEDTTNYNGLEKTIEFVISQKAPELTAAIYNMSNVYYENSVDVENCYVTPASVVGGIAGTTTYSKPVLATTTTTTSKAYETVNFDIVFTPTDTRNYLQVKTQSSINLYKVAYIGDKYYGSIENAVNSAKDSERVVVIPDNTGNVTIASDLTIKSGVTLVLPYLNPAGAIETNETGVATLNSWNLCDLSIYVSGFTCLNLTTKVVVKQNVTIANNGTIVISGELNGGSPAGIRSEYASDKNYKANGIAGNTARNYAKLVLQSGAKIISNGEIKCTGYIDEDSADNGSEVIVEKGKIYMPYILRDFRGGNYMYSAISYSEGGFFNKTKIPITPYNQFEFRNIVPKFTIKYNATLIGYANLFAGKQNNFTEGTIISNTSAALIQFITTNSYMVAKYNILERPADGSDKWVDGINEIDFYGGVKINSLSLKVKILTEITVSTKDVFFPLSWRFDVAIHNGTYTLDNKFKLMPGAKLTVESDAILNANMLTIYDSFDDLLTKANGDIIAETQYDYNVTLSPAELIIKGTLNVTSLGGNVIAGSDGAVVNVTNVACKSYEIISGENTMVGDTKIGWTITGVQIFGETSSLQNGTNVITLTSGGKYTAKDGTWSK